MQNYYLLTGPDAARWCPLIQKAFYNGWKSIHGLKHQTVDCAYGMTIDMYGPYSLRRNDLKLFRDSRINNRLEDLQNGQLLQLGIYGDSIYPHMTHTRSRWPDEVTTADRTAENKAFTKVRISIEWNYKTTGQIFGKLRQHDKLKILDEGTVAKLYTVCTILRNCHVALYGSQTSQYFNLDIPHNFLEEYLQV
jgi:hypothetical protein